MYTRILHLLYWIRNERREHGRDYAAQACATARPPGEEESAGLGSPPVTVRIQISAQPPYATASHQDLENCVELDSRKKRTYCDFM